MKFREYLRDRLPFLLIGAVSLFFALIFLFAWHAPLPAVIASALVLILGGASAEAWCFIKKKRYFDSLASSFDALDQKYLLPAMLPEPDFAEARILSEVLWDTDKAMCDRIAGYRRESEEFREYIELWVHEIKLPVAGLWLMCANDGAVRYEEQLYRVDECIENVLYYARSGSAERDYLIAPVSLKRVFTETAVRCRREVQERGVTLVTEGLEAEVMTDGKWLGFIFGQLLNNSLKYGAKTIRVTAEDSPEKTVLRFWDDGIGIPPDDLPRIFDKSFTGENGRRGKASTGMGLHIVKTLAGKLGHGIGADSRRGEYTEITLVFGKSGFTDAAAPK